MTLAGRSQRKDRPATLKGLDFIKSSHPKATFGKTTFFERQKSTKMVESIESKFRFCIRFFFFLRGPVSHRMPPHTKCHPPHPARVASGIRLEGSSRKSPNPARAGLPPPPASPKIEPWATMGWLRRRLPCNSLTSTFSLISTCRFPYVSYRDPC